jgi:hypothetical protein
LAQDAPWKNARWTLTPAGFVPSPVDPGGIVPICSPGLPLTMAAFRVLHLSEFLIVPILGALAVWLTFVIGRRVDRPLTGVAAAILTAASPTFLYQVVQPMSDVPATAWWLLAATWSIERDDNSRRPLLAGLAASMALLTRPNLLPLAVVIAGYLFASARERRPWRDAIRFVTALVPGLLLLAVLQWTTYGSPLATGYGNTRDFFSVANVVPNLRRYVGWLLAAHAGFLLLAFAAPLAMRRRRHAWLCLTLSGATVMCYLPYLVFDDWWYTRFLLPAIPLLVVLSVAVLVAGLEQVARTWTPPDPALGGPSNDPQRPRSAVFDGIVLGVLAVMAVIWIVTARNRHAFELSDWEQHYYRGGAAAARVPRPSVIVTIRNSGSVLYHTGSPILSWDTLDPASLDSALAFVRDRGYAAYLLLEIDEEPSFRERFSAASQIGRLDWPPRVQVGRTIRIYDPLDRARFLSDGKVRTEFLAESPVPRRDWRRWLR